ncbi:hypothetical protein JMY81_11730 [Brenneria goodwinii]|uniref:hypothetical protein n=1 Tax=Brenneria goodwinii TaxID=1109412 RepID=UPI000EF1F4CE|nr:hypothetical protein [Brenneria goodwinii]MCG8156913.1 hypothetical protein [Brenneria goodwinii]MCG8161498.1 hypothetical protein [Brenneria goodwinii]MCG8165613.1 hypothetical protein [Brenneria goodwinii]MCG8170101.1 hypothetical protein [Brenneria goodwinii]MCG8174311.1 hypothetical protein [Brenneria goodwinii]
MRRKKIIVFTSCHYYYTAIECILNEKLNSSEDVIYYPVSLLTAVKNDDGTQLILWPQADRFIFVLQNINDLCVFLRFASDVKNSRYLNQERITIIGKENIFSLLVLCYKNIDPQRFIPEDCTVKQLDDYLHACISQKRLTVKNRMKSRLARCQMEVLISLLAGRRAKRDAQEKNKSIKTIYGLRQKALNKLNCQNIQDLYRFL